MFYQKLPRQKFLKLLFSGLFFSSLFAPPPGMIKSDSWMFSEDISFITWVGASPYDKISQQNSSSYIKISILAFSKKMKLLRFYVRGQISPSCNGLQFIKNLEFSSNLNSYEVMSISESKSQAPSALVVLKYSHGNNYNKIGQLIGSTVSPLNIAESSILFSVAEVKTQQPSSPTNQTFATGSTDGFVKVWQFEGHPKNIYSKTHEFGGFLGAITFLAWSPDEECLAAASDGGSVGVFLLAAVVVAPAGAAAAQPAQAAAAVEVEAPRIPQAQGTHRGAVSCMAWSQSSEHLATGSLDHTVKIWNRDGRFMAELPHRDEVLCLEWNFIGWLATGAKDRMARVWNLTEDRANCLLEIPQPTAVYSLVWYPTGQYLIAGGGTGSAAIWRVNETSAAIVDTLPCGINKPVLCAKWSPDFQELALAAGGVVCIWPISKQYLDELRDGFNVNSKTEETPMRNDVIRNAFRRFLDTVVEETPVRIGRATLDRVIGGAANQ